MRDALALALVHFLWQGTVLAIVAWALMRLAQTPSVRYAIGVATMLAMLAAPVLTFVALQSKPTVASQASIATPDASASNAPLTQMAQPTTLATDVRAASTPPAPRLSVPSTWILSVWMIGVVMLSLRFAGGLVVAHRLATRTLTPVGDDLQRLASRLAARLNVRVVVRVCESASVAMPIMIGWLRPIIVMPPAALAALPLSQLEALLAHEFAHIRRHDYLVNLLQTAIETVCFYHPAVWWTSREVRRHRELCCDDVAVGVCDRLTYVSALSSLASMSTPQLAMAATGGSLRDRIRRLIEPTTHSASAKGGWMAMLPILLVVSFVAPHAWEGQSTPPVTASPAVIVEQAAPVVEQARPVEQASVEQASTITAQRAEAAKRAAEAPAPRESEAFRRMLAVQQEQVRDQGRERDQQVREQEQKLLALEARQRLVEVQKTIAERRLELERRMKTSQSQAEQAAAEIQLRDEERELARQRDLFEKGLATRELLAQTESRLVSMRQRLELAKRNHAFAEEDHSIRRQELELQHQAAFHEALSERQAVEERRVLRALDASATLQPNDQLTIAVDSEPDLPTTFTVRADGSIRFPFLGSIRVQGSTAAQVQAAIQKLLLDKGLAQNSAVSVTGRRGR